MVIAVTIKLLSHCYLTHWLLIPLDTSFCLVVCSFIADDKTNGDETVRIIAEHGTESRKLQEVSTKCITTESRCQWCSGRYPWPTLKEAIITCVMAATRGYMRDSGDSQKCVDSCLLIDLRISIHMDTWIFNRTLRHPAQSRAWMKEADSRKGNWPLNPKFKFIWT